MLKDGGLQLDGICIHNFFYLHSNHSNIGLQHSSEEEQWAHNPKVPRSKLGAATDYFLQRILMNFNDGMSFDYGKFLRWKILLQP